MRMSVVFVKSVLQKHWGKIWTAVCIILRSRREGMKLGLIDFLFGIWVFLSVSEACARETDGLAASAPCDIREEDARSD